MDVQEIRERVVIFVEEMFVEFSPRNHFSAVEREIFQNGKLPCCQRNGLAAAGY